MKDQFKGFTITDDGLFEMHFDKGYIISLYFSNDDINCIKHPLCDIAVFKDTTNITDVFFPNKSFDEDMCFVKGCTFDDFIELMAIITSLSDEDYRQMMMNDLDDETILSLNDAIISKTKLYEG